MTKTEFCELKNKGTSTSCGFLANFVNYFTVCLPIRDVNRTVRLFQILKKINSERLTFVSECTHVNNRCC